MRGPFLITDYQEDTTYYNKLLYFLKNIVYLLYLL